MITTEQRRTNVNFAHQSDPLEEAGLSRNICFSDNITDSIENNFHKI